jgi:formylglycine-generating enzyme required for sulfatase activity
LPEAWRAIREEAAALPESQRKQLAAYLCQVPASIRQSLRRPSDRTGTTVPPGMGFRKANDLLRLLPPKLPRFQPGDWPLANSDLEVVELLGQGGFGEVWKARHLDRPTLPPVALKLCLDAAAARSLERERDLLDRVAAVARHDGIVQLLYTHLRAEPPCLEYELVEGGDLAGLIAELHANGKAAPERVAKIVLRLATIVANAHQQQPAIVHRDLKPANILHGKQGFKIADFGIGGVVARKTLLDLRTGKTKPSERKMETVLGAYTPLYASPEQMNDGPIDPRDDVHALGIIWYQLQTGNLSLMSLPSHWRDDLVTAGMPVALLDILGACIGRLDQRPNNAGNLVTRLERALRHGPVPSELPTQPNTTAGSRWVAGLVSLAVLMTATAFCVGLAFFFSKGSPDPNVQVAETTKTSNPPEPKDPVWLPLKSADLPKSYVVPDVGITMCLIPAGSFLMGAPDGEEGRFDNEKLHKVRLTQPFYLAAHPVTRGQFGRFVSAENYKTEGERAGDKLITWRNPGFAQDDDHPVVCVSWNDAVAFCGWLSRVTGQTYGLPTEAQWEYACRGRALLGGSDPYHFGKTITPLNANYADSKINGTTKVGKYAPNGFGLFDMHGNVWQWCADWYGDYATDVEQIDPRGPGTGTGRVFRGGSWLHAGRYCRAAYRYGLEPSSRLSYLGLRVSRVPYGAK